MNKLFIIAALLLSTACGGTMTRTVYVYGDAPNAPANTCLNCQYAGHGYVQHHDHLHKSWREAGLCRSNGPRGPYLARGNALPPGKRVSWSWRP